MLALRNEHDTWWSQGCSSRPDGARPLLKEVWAATVPQKFRIFAWKLTQEGLTTTRRQEEPTIGKDWDVHHMWKEDETRYHAVVNCPKAKALRWELR
jgi:hypothetical protein